MSNYEKKPKRPTLEDPDDSEEESPTPVKKRARKERYLGHAMAEEYVDVALKLVAAPMSSVGVPYGYDATKYPLENIDMLAYLQHPARRLSVVERWSPYEIGLFEGAMSHHGKEFHKIQRVIKTKTTQEIVEFYYVWKKTSHYSRWKVTYIPPYGSHLIEEGERR